MTKSERAFLFMVLPAATGLALGLSIGNTIATSTQGRCNCTIDYNGQPTSIEDTIDHLQEGLSADQADEVQTMINNSIGK